MTWKGVRECGTQQVLPSVKGAGFNVIDLLMDVPMRASIARYYDEKFMGDVAQSFVYLTVSKDQTAGSRPPRLASDPCTGNFAAYVIAICARQRRTISRFSRGDARQQYPLRVTAWQQTAAPSGGAGAWACTGGRAT